MLSKEQALMFEHVLFFVRKWIAFYYTVLPKKKKWSLRMFHYHKQVHVGYI